MTEQELKNKFQSEADWMFSVQMMNEDQVVELAKAYADAQVANECKVRVNLLHQTIATNNAEIKRLREFAQQCQQHPQKMVRMNWFEDGSFDYCDLVPLQEAAARVLSPAPVTPKKLICVQCKHLVRANGESGRDKCGLGNWFGDRGDVPIDDYLVEIDPWVGDGCFDSPKNEDQE